MNNVYKIPAGASPSWFVLPHRIKDALEKIINKEFPTFMPER